MSPRIGLLFVLPVALALGCPFPEEITACEDVGACGSTGSTTTTDDDPIPTSSEPIATLTGDSTGSTSPDLGDTTDEPPSEPPQIVAVEMTPDYIDVNGLIAANIDTQYADGVRMLFENGDIIELELTGPDAFSEHINAFTGLENGKHLVVFTPWRGDIIGASVSAEYVISLPPPGHEVAWQTPEVDGHITAIDVLPDGRPVELGTYYELGEPRCYLRLREKTGAPLELAPILPSAHCSAIDLKIDHDTGVLHVLLEREGGNGSRWWVMEIPAWGAGAKKVDEGEPGDIALALATRPGLIAVCGAKPVNTDDKFDALAVLLRPNAKKEERLFDLQRGDDIKPHLFGETARDCAFVGDKLVLVGEATGQHEDVENLPPRDRLTIVEHDTVANTSEWIVAGPGPGLQSRALAIDVDDQGRYHLAGYSCLDDCKPEGEIRIYAPGGKLDELMSLGLLGSEWFGPHDIACSPAGYDVVALGAEGGQTSVFKVEAYAPGVFDALWSFTPVDGQGLLMSLTVAVGPYGEVYAGGIGANDHPAFAVIGG